MQLYPHEPIGDILARIREEAKTMLYIDTTNSTIRTEKGGEVLAHYRLQRRRRWNIGLRRHACELTGLIEVCREWGHNNYGVATFDNWNEVREHVERMEE